MWNLTNQWFSEGDWQGGRKPTAFANPAQRDTALAFPTEGLDLWNPLIGHDQTQQLEV